MNHDDRTSQADRLDETRTAARVAHRIAGTPAGRTTLRRRSALIGSVAGAAALAVGGVAVAQPWSAATAPVVAGPTTPSSTTPTGSGSPEVRTATWYATNAEAAALEADAILQMDMTTQYPADEVSAAFTMSTTQYVAADGTAMRWVMTQDTGPYPISPGTEDDKYTLADGSLRYVYVDREQGVYTEFTPEIPQDLIEESGTIEAQIAAIYAEIGTTTAVILDLAQNPSVTQSPTEETEIGGVPAVCFTYSGSLAEEENEDLASWATGDDWVSRYCFEPVSGLPLLEETVGQDSGYLSRTTYTWHANTPENQQLLQPDTTGLTKVDLADFPMG